jgi:hypothetical protein
VFNSIEQPISTKVASTSHNQAQSVNNTDNQKRIENDTSVSHPPKVATSVSKDKLLLSESSIEQWLSKVLLSPSDTLSFSNTAISNSMSSRLTERYLDSNLNDSLESVQDNYLHLSKQSFTITEFKYVDLESDRTARIAELSKSHIRHSKQAHTQVKEILSNLGRLDEDAQQYLANSEYYIEGEINKLEKLALASKEENNYFTFEVKTQEGDTIFIKYHKPNFALADLDSISLHSNFSITVDGDISEEEQHALEALYEKASVFIEDNLDTMQSNNKGFSLDKLVLGDSFDSSILTGFEINMQENLNKSSYHYQIDKANQTQTLTTSMQHATKQLSYDFSLTTGLNQSQDNGQLAKNIEQLKKVLDDSNGSFAGNSGLNQYLLDSYSSLFTNMEAVNNNDSDNPNKATTLNLVNDQLLGLEYSLPSMNLMKFSTLMDFEFTLSVMSRSGLKTYDTQIDMSQNTQIETVNQTKKITQSKQLDVESEIVTYIPNSLDVKSHSRDYHWQQTLSATLDNAGKLSNYKSISNESIEDIKKRIESSGKVSTEINYKENSALLDLKVLDDVINITKANTAVEENKSIVKFKDQRPITLSHDKQVSAYLEVESYKLPSGKIS